MQGYRYDALDGVRGLAAQVVLFGHAAGLAFIPGPGPGAAVVSWTSRLAVMVFFALSGFVIATSLARLVRSDGGGFLVPYAVHRWARIWPPLVAAVAVAFAVGALGRAGLPLVDLRGPDYALGPLAFLRGITLTFAPTDATFALDGPLWSLRQEVWLYGLAGLAALAVVRDGFVRIAAAAGVAVMVAVTADRFFYPQSLALFACGALAALYGHEPRLRGIARAPLLGAGLVVLAAAPLAVLPLDAAFLAALSNGPGFLAYQTLLAPPLAALLLGLALSDGPVARCLARAAWSARFSYTLYVVHNPVLVLVFSLRAALGLWPGTGGSAITFAVAVALAQAVSYGLARLVERPALFRALAFRALAAAGITRPALPSPEWEKGRG
jgi:peptidoglycan/LPS O-acetylase OafA/YrhL